MGNYKDNYKKTPSEQARRQDHHQLTAHLFGSGQELMYEQ